MSGETRGAQEKGEGGIRAVDGQSGEGCAGNPAGKRQSAPPRNAGGALPAF